MAVILNPSFESDGANWALETTATPLSGWFNTDWATDGVRSILLDWARGEMGAREEHGWFKQDVDMSSLEKITLDNHTEFNILEGNASVDARVRIGDSIVWQKHYASTGHYNETNEEIDVSAFSGVHALRLGMDVHHGAGESNMMVMVYYDNLRETLAEPSAARHRFTGGLLHRAVH
jgi:hypothetical protein